MPLKILTYKTFLFLLWSLASHHGVFSLLLNITLTQAWGIFVGRGEMLMGAQELPPVIQHASPNALGRQVPSPIRPKGR